MLRVDYNVSEKARMWFKASATAAITPAVTSAAINNQWGLADGGLRADHAPTRR